MHPQKKAAAATATQSRLHESVYTDDKRLSSLNLQIGQYLLNLTFTQPADLRAYRWQQFQKHLSQLAQLKHGRVRA